MRTLNKIGNDLHKNWIRYLMVLPAVATLFVFCYLPLVGLVMAFKKLDYRRGVFGGDWIGFKNFEFLFKTQDAWVITRNTVLYNALWIFLGLVLAVLLALLMNEMLSKKLAKTLQTIYIMPYFLSMVVVSAVVFAFLSSRHGFVNQMLPESIDFYATKGPWPYLLTLVRMWTSVGYSSIIYMAVISGISQEFYESAVLDGASKLQQAWYITIPHLKPIIAINLIRSMGGMFRSDFGLFYQVPKNSAMLYSVTDTLDTYIYRGLTTLNNPSMSTAAGLYQSVVGLVLVLIANKIVSKLDEDCAMF